MCLSSQVASVKNFSRKILQKIDTYTSLYRCFLINFFKFVSIACGSRATEMGKRWPTSDSKHASSAIRTYVLCQLGQKGHLNIRLALECIITHANKILVNFLSRYSISRSICVFSVFLLHHSGSHGIIICILYLCMLMLYSLDIYNHYLFLFLIFISFLFTNFSGLSTYKQTAFSSNEVCNRLYDF